MSSSTEVSLSFQGQIIHKTDKVFAEHLKVKLTEKHVGSMLRFHFQPVSHLSMSNYCNTDQTVQVHVQNHKIEFITSPLASMPHH